MLYVIVEGSIDLSVGGIVALSAIAVAKTVGVLGGFAVIPAVLIGILCGAINGCCYTFLKIPTFITTMATMTAFRGIVLIITGGAQIMITDKRFIGLFNGSYLPSIPNNVIMVIIITVIMWYIYNNFAFSREDDPMERVLLLLHRARHRQSLRLLEPVSGQQYPRCHHVPY